MDAPDGFDVGDDPRVIQARLLVDLVERQSALEWRHAEAERLQAESDLRQERIEQALGDMAERVECLASRPAPAAVDPAPEPAPALADPDSLRDAVRRVGVMRVSRLAEMSERTIRRFLSGERQLSAEFRARIAEAVESIPPKPVPGPSPEPQPNGPPVEWPAQRRTLVNFRTSEAYREWFQSVADGRKITRLIRDAVREWSERRGLPPPPRI